jgi:hypothetical protein
MRNFDPQNSNSIFFLKIGSSSETILTTHSHTILAPPPLLLLANTRRKANIAKIFIKELDVLFCVSYKLQPDIFFKIVV